METGWNFMWSVGINCYNQPMVGLTNWFTLTTLKCFGINQKILKKTFGLQGLSKSIPVL